MDPKRTKSRLLDMERRRRALEEQIKSLQRKELQALPAQVGLDSVDALILALLEHASPGMQARFRPAAGQVKGQGLARKSPRVRFTEELRAQIRRELEAGHKSVAEISREYGPSHPTIMGWKREWGMTRPRRHRGS